MRHIALTLISILCFFGSIHPARAEEEVPRTIIALYDDHGEGISTAAVHKVGTLPMNHLGLTVEYYDIHGPLPKLDGRTDVRGIITWFIGDTVIDKPDDYLRWMIHAADLGKKVVVMGHIGLKAPRQTAYSPALVRSLLDKIGVRILEKAVNEPLKVTYQYGEPEMFLNHEPFQWQRTPYYMVETTNPEAQVHLTAHTDKEGDSALLVTSPGGGYTAYGYTYRTTMRAGEEVPQWIINPFEFFRLAFATDDLPKPDTTTIAGRRMYYSHIDGDGWNNRTYLEEYHKHPVLASQVVMDKAVKAYPDLPVSLTIIAADIDPDAAMVDDSRKIAKEFLALPQVEAGTHTYSHPFAWQFFKDGDWKKEIPYLKAYTTPTWKPQSEGVVSQVKKEEIASVYSVPRAYAYKKFDIHQEVNEAIQKVSELLPPGKKLELYTWSGNCLPWEGAIRLTREAGVRNINGGDTRFDMSYPSYASVAPVGAPMGKERQIYASMSNEISYTHLWSENLYSHIYLVRTMENTESPMRLKPINLYYHIYSGENEAAFHALKSNLDYVRTQEVAPIKASQFTRIAEGFFDVKLILTAPETWRVENRDELQTIRFDHASFKAVDFERSKGVVGQRYFQGSLYVYLDKAEKAPVVALKKNAEYFQPPEDALPYLIQSRWLVSDLKRDRARMEFTAQGYGAGEMVWQVPVKGSYSVQVGKGKELIVPSQDHELHLKLGEGGIEPQRIIIRKISDGGKHA